MIRRSSILVAALATLLAASAPVLASSRSKKLALPAERTSPTGNFFTLEAYVAPTSHNRVANFEMKVCTSKHTPSYTEIVPSFFTLILAGGARLPETVAVAKSPAIVIRPLKPLQCTQGWLGFVVPSGKSVSTLEYQYNGKIAWKVG